ncbi:MAG: hypothetical protein ABDH37_07675 [Candidatus Hydrothermales bacterium]
MRKFYFTLIFLLFIECKRNYEEIKLPTYVLWSALNSSYEPVEQIVFVDRFYNPEEQADLGLSDLDVRIKFLNSEYILKEKIVMDRDSDRYLVYSDSFYVPPGIECTLRVSFPNSENLKCITNVPSDFNVIYPKNYDTVIVPSNDLLIWEKSFNSKLYTIYIRKNLSDSFLLFFSPDTFLDLFRRENVFKSEGFYEIYIRAENEDIYHWNLNREDRIKEEWVKGVFGAYVERFIKVYVKLKNET